MKNALAVACISAWTLTMAQLSVAQSPPTEQQPAEQDATGKNDARNLKTKSEQLDELTEGIARQAAETEKLQSKVEQHQELIGKLEAESEDVEFERYREMSTLMTEIEEATKRRVNVYGFFDLTFCKNVYDNLGGFTLLVPDKSSFAVTGLNLYFQSEPVDDVAFLAEVRFGYQPDGTEGDYEVENVPGTVYEQFDTSVRNSYTAEEFDQGGISIIRVNLTYQPWDYLYIKAGRFLTPFGIWNLDHGSPVVLPARLPYIMQQRIILPLVQTGLVIGGKLFPTDTLILNYALTLSNGRGQSEAIFDSDEHKALGLRLHGTWQHREAQVSLGTYGYIGTRRDIKKVVTIAGPTTDPEGKVPDGRPYIVEVKDGTAVDEAKQQDYVVTADFQLNWQGLRLQTEYAWKFRDYNAPPLMYPTNTIAKGGVPFVDRWYKPSHTGYDIYGLVAYTLPLQRLIGSFRITPYYLFERSRPFDAAQIETLDMHVVGINMAPWPALVIKLEVTWVLPEETDLMGDRLLALAAQMAVSF